ncbi:MAG TPA: type II toxin-antitoxin system VapC family toxin [Allosphingosinicella sp.]|nr:type II toxin-antitoxin system VapC family toxin [Allosphingosinicella sp.]
MILLDTNVLLWRTGEDRRLGKQARRTIDRAVDRNAACVSVISLWEIATLIRKQRIRLGQPLRDWSRIAFASPGLRLMPVDERIAIDAGELEGIPGDPADRTIIATARALACPLLTADSEILAYAEQGHVQAIDATR